ncbi:MAG: FxLYD domain-containing protein, partial [Terracidiphilus sp.]
MTTGHSGYDIFVMKKLKSLSRIFRLSLVLLQFTIPALAKDAPLQVVDWPATGTPLVRFTFSKIKALPGMNTLHGYVLDITAENLSPKLISDASYTLYLFDKNKVRVGENVVSLTNVGPGETVKFQSTVMASGLPVSVSIQEDS